MRHVGSLRLPASLTISKPFLNLLTDFHCQVALAVNCVHSPTKEDAAEELRHLSRAFHLINDNLSGPDALTDFTMAAIVAMTQFERQRGHFDRSLIHFKGLQRIINLRGGAAQMVHMSPAVIQKVFRWAFDPNRRCVPWMLTQCAEPTLISL
jgi:hypothetical protein